MKTNLTIFTAFIFLFMIGACNNEGTSNEEKDVHEQTVDSESEKHEVHWSYEGETGPEKWAEIIPDCDCNGKAQSPIDISGDMLDVDFVELKLDYKTDSILDIINNGHTVQVNYPFGTFTYAGDEYKLVQFHFHATSEHTLNGEYFPLEAHLVHVTDDNKIAVIGIWFNEGEENELLKKIYENVPDEADEVINESMVIDVKNVLPVDHSYYHYVGSLTTPPCTEGVNWFVMKNAREASKEQIELIKNAMPSNNFRPIQPLNDRKIEDF